MADDRMHIHNFTDTVIPPTCKARGYTLHSCRCGYVHKDSFTDIGPHRFQLDEGTEATCTADGYRKSHCTVCGERKESRLPALGHDWSPWNVQTFATCMESGQKQRICKRCAEVEQQTIAPKGHSLRKSKNEKGKPVHFCENCGEEVHVSTFAEKCKAFLAKRKKLLLGIAAGLVAVPVAVLLAVNVVIPQFHYTLGKCYLQLGAAGVDDFVYQKAFEHFYACADYRDSEDYLLDFSLIIEKKTTDNRLDSKKSLTGTWVQPYIYQTYNGLLSQANRYFDVQFDDYGNPTMSVTYDKDGRIASRITYVYQYNDQGIMIACKEYLNGELQCDCTYNDQGILIKELEYSQYDGELDFESTYDDRGNITEFIYYDGEEIRRHSRYQNHYDEKGRLVSRTCYDKGTPDGQSRYTYYSNGKPRKTESFYENGNLSSKTSYYRNGEPKQNKGYNEDGQLSSETSYYRNGEPKQNKRYNEDGQLIYEYSYYRNGKEKQNKKYNEDGQLIYEYSYFKNGSVKSSIAYNEEGETTFKRTGKKNGSCSDVTYEDGKLIKKEKLECDKYGRETSWQCIKKEYGTEFPENIFPETEVLKRKTKYKILEVRYLPHYAETHTK